MLGKVQFLLACIICVVVPIIESWCTNGKELLLSTSKSLHSPRVVTADCRFKLSCNFFLMSPNIDLDIVKTFPIGVRGSENEDRTPSNNMDGCPGSNDDDDTDDVWKTLLHTLKSILYITNVTIITEIM